MSIEKLAEDLAEAKAIMAAAEAEVQKIESAGLRKIAELGIHASDFEDVYPHLGGLINEALDKIPADELEKETPEDRKLGCRLLDFLRNVADCFICNMEALEAYYNENQDLIAEVVRRAKEEKGSEMPEWQKQAIAPLNLANKVGDILKQMANDATTAQARWYAKMPNSLRKIEETGGAS